MKTQPFTVNLSQSILDELQNRLKHTRFPQIDPRVTGWDNGADLVYMRELIRYWADEFDWRKSEKEINSFANYKTTIDGIEIHFIHEKSNGTNGKPILLTHGWPDSFYRFHKVIPLLTKEYDLVLPSIPGFGFSAHEAVNSSKVAELWRKLMTEVLGYEKFFAHGGDTGSMVTIALAREHGDVVEAIHLTDVGYYVSELDPETTMEAEKEYLDKLNAWSFKEGAYAALHLTKPLSVSYALSDSPAGLAAWMISAVDGFSDNHDVETSFGSRDELLTNLTLYWVTQTAGSAIQVYKEEAGSAGDWSADGSAEAWSDEAGTGNWSAGEPEKIMTPTAIAVFPRDADFPKEYAERQGLNVQRYRRYSEGGHWPALEMPEIFANEILEAFQELDR
jgi:pimeloyl-ACP methyl ester carboxylesterase